MGATALLEFDTSDTGLVIGDLTLQWCKKQSDDSDVVWTDAALAERGNGVYKLTNPNVTVLTGACDFRVYITADQTKYIVGTFEPQLDAPAQDDTVAKAIDLATVATYVDTEITTILDRLGAWTGSGANTILGAIKALASKVAAAVSDIGGTFDSSTDSLEALQENIDALPTLTEITNAGGMGGLISAVVDVGVTISATFIPVTMEKGEKKVLSYRVMQDSDTPFDLSAYTGKLAVKRDLYDTAAAIGPLDAVISAHEDDEAGVQSVMTYTIPTATTKAMSPFQNGRYSVAIYDVGLSKTVLTPAGGVEFNLLEDTLDVA